MDSKSLFVDNFKYYMGINNKSRYNVSKDLKIGYTTICDWVKGVSVPRPTNLDKLAKYFGIEVNDFYVDRSQYKDDYFEKDSLLTKSIYEYARDKHQEELLIKSTLLNLDNTKNAVEHINYLLYKQDKEDEEFKYLDNYDDKNYTK
ncbi:MAG: helix-turn-helix transcriptional regulator [Clostridia bacterium]|nr:helix-turn-helix transcriptional regulator [Clostridia bacterium]